MFPDPSDELATRERMQRGKSERTDIPFSNSDADLYADLRADGVSERDAAEVIDLGYLPFKEWRELYAA